MSVTGKDTSSSFDEQFFIFSPVPWICFLGQR